MYQKNIIGLMAVLALEIPQIPSAFAQHPTPEEDEIKINVSKTHPTIQSTTNSDDEKSDGSGQNTSFGTDDENETVEEISQDSLKDIKISDEEQQGDKTILDLISPKMIITNVSSVGMRVGDKWASFPNGPFLQEGYYKGIGLYRTNGKEIILDRELIDLLETIAILNPDDTSIVDYKLGRLGASQKNIDFLQNVSRNYFGCVPYFISCFKKETLSDKERKALGAAFFWLNVHPLPPRFKLQINEGLRKLIEMKLLSPKDLQLNNLDSNLEVVYNEKNGSIKLISIN